MKITNSKCNKCGHEEATLKCDKCGVESHIAMFNEKPSDGAYEEFITIKIKAGWFSQYWGDCTKAEIDLCEKCHYEMFKEIARISTYVP